MTEHWTGGTSNSKSGAQGVSDGEQTLAEQEPLRVPNAFTIAAILPEADRAMAALNGLQVLSGILPSATLLALHIDVDPRRLIADDEEVAMQMLREKREGSSADRAVEVRKVFDAWSETAEQIGKRTTWRKLVGGEEQIAVKALRDVDLIAIARPRNLDGRDALHGLLFSHHLVLVVPPDWRPIAEGFGHRIAVGWTATKQVDHAMLLTLPLLRAADRVSLLAIDQPGDNYLHDYVLRLIQQTGVKPELHHIQSGARSIGRTLLEETQKIGADSLVVGAYKHGQLWGQIFGGVTREIIENSDVPVFMAH